VTSISWRSNRSASMLLSTSTDSSVILWCPSSFVKGSDRASSLWINQHRFGDVGGQRLGGFVGGIWARTGSEVIASGWSGGFRRWQSSRSTPDTDGAWTEAEAVGGHSGPVSDAHWSPSGEYLISVGYVSLITCLYPLQRLYSDLIKLREYMAQLSLPTEWYGAKSLVPRFTAMIS
jgi:elongator complex protein 2